MINCIILFCYSYCINIAFYFLMKSLRKPVQNHPIMNSLLRYRETLCEQNEIYETLIKPQIDKILSMVHMKE